MSLGNMVAAQTIAAMEDAKRLLAFIRRVLLRLLNGVPVEAYNEKVTQLSNAVALAKQWELKTKEIKNFLNQDFYRSLPPSPIELLGLPVEKEKGK